MKKINREKGYQSPNPKGKNSPSNNPFQVPSPVPRIIITKKQKKWLNFQRYAKISKDPKYSKNSLVSLVFSAEATYSNTPPLTQIVKLSTTYVKFPFPDYSDSRGLPVGGSWGLYVIED